MSTTAIHANPLTLWVPVKQDAIHQFIVKELLKRLEQGGLITDPAHFLHFARFVGIPNVNGHGIMGLLLVTEFDGTMPNYLKYFFDKPAIRAAFASLYIIAETAPMSPENLTNFEKYINANNLTQPEDLSYAYTATVAEIVSAFPPAPTGNHANPLTLWVPVKQDATTQAAVKQLLVALKGGGLIQNDGNFLYFARTVGIPNSTGGYTGVLIITEFVGDMDPYLKFFYARPEIQTAFTAIYQVALNPPMTPNNLSNFEKFINGNNLSQSSSLLYAYRATVSDIVTKFPPTV